MGNGQSAAARKFLNPEPDFADYTVSEWRSTRAVELDTLGGLGRQPVLLGQSFNAKMQFLGSQLHEQGERLQEVIAPTERGTKEQLLLGRRQTLNTERRAAERRGEVLPAQAEVMALENLHRRLPVAAVHRLSLPLHR